jgi:hypothetical protein
MGTHTIFAAVRHHPFNPSLPPLRIRGGEVGLEEPFLLNSNRKKKCVIY